MNKKISQLPYVESTDGDEDIPILSQGNNRRFKLSQLLSYFTKERLGLGQVDNTADKDKPISDPAQIALNNKANSAHNHDVNEVIGLFDILINKSDDGHGHSIGDVNGLISALNNKANILHNHAVSDINGFAEYVNLLLDGYNNGGEVSASVIEW
jgi:hypothetical protein